MAASGPPASLSIQSYSQGGGGGGSGGSSDSFRTRGRNRSSAGSSGSCSREPSVEGRRGHNRRGLELGGGGDFRASYHNQYHGPAKREFERVSWGQQQQLDGPENDANGRMGGQNWGFGSEGGGNSREQFWRSNRGGHHGRVQGGFPDDGGAVGSASSARGYAVMLGGQGRGGGPYAPPQRQENGYADHHNRPENGYGGGIIQRQENSHGGISQRQENGHGGYEFRGGYGRAASQVGGSRGRPSTFDVERGAGSLWVLPGRDAGGSKEDVFGGARELQTFGSPRGLSRTVKANNSSFRSPKEEARLQWGMSNDARNARDVGGASVNGFRDGDLRRSFTNENVDRVEGRRKNSNSSSGSSSNGGHLDSTQAHIRRGSFDVSQEARQMIGHGGAPMQKRRDQSQSIRGGDEGQRVQLSLSQKRGEEFVNPSLRSSSKGGSSYSRKNSFDGGRDVSGVVPVLSPNLSSKGSFSRKNSFDTQKKREESAQLQVFSPLSEAKADIEHESSFEKLSQENSFSESTPKDPVLEGDERWSEAKQHLPSKGWESASAGMHRTRSTDWYEICLKEEEEEEQRQALARKHEEESKPGRQNLPPIKVRTSGRDQQRQESWVVSPSSARGEIKRETNNLDRASLLERFVRQDAADSAQPNVSTGQRSSDSGGKQGLFTPWNSLQQSVPSIRTGPQSAPRVKSVQFEKSSGEQRDGPLKHENLRVSVIGGRQANGRGRRTVHTIRNDEAENWRPEGRVERDSAKDGFGSEGLLEDSTASRSGHVIPKQTKAVEWILTPPVDTEKTVPEVVIQRVNGAIRPAAFYRAVHEATAGDDEPLPHIVGTCPDMCPGKERLQRERLRDLAIFERVSGDMRKTSKELAVKKFCRTVVASELEQSDVRPLPVLWRTQQYLLGLLDDPEFAFDIVHNFLFDRTRAIRQELGMQRILDRQTIIMHEEIVRFHIISEHELREQNRQRSKQFDTHLNLQQLSKSLYSLLNLYIRLGSDDEAHFENEAEFHAYYVLLNLGNHGQFQAEPLSLWFPNVPSRVLEDSPMQFARKALRLYRTKNFVGFFRSVREATYLQSCLLELNFDAVRAMALAMLNVAEYKLHPYPLSDLAQQLILEEKQVDELCMYYGLLTGIDKSSQKLCLMAKQGQFAVPDRDNRPQYGCSLIDGKRAPSYFQEVKGGIS